MTSLYDILWGLKVVVDKMCYHKKEWRSQTPCLVGHPAKTITKTHSIFLGQSYFWFVLYMLGWLLSWVSVTFKNKNNYFEVVLEEWPSRPWWWWWRGGGEVSPIFVVEYLWIADHHTTISFSLFILHLSSSLPSSCNTLFFNQPFLLQRTSILSLSLS